MEKREGEPMQEDHAEEFISMDHVNSIEDRVQALSESNEVHFNDWVLLIAEVENISPNDIQKICLVYDSFLSEFPLCYGYWTRYAGHKACFCSVNEAEEVFEQAVKIASHSVHLWVSYCNFAVSSFEDPADVRRLFERGVSYVGKDYLCHLLWDKYIEFEYCQKQWNRLAHIYTNTLRFPTRKLQRYYESFRKLVALLEEQMESHNALATAPEAIPDHEMMHVHGCGYSEISNAVDLLGENLTGHEALKKYLSIGELLYQKSSQLDKSISYFEAHIQRQYFHIKPLDEFQLQNWHDYLTFVEEQGDFDWTVKLYERCLIPCANFLEFWIRYVDFVDAKGGREIANDALDRALKVFLKRIPAFHQYYSMYKEKIGDAVNARAPFLQRSECCDVIENVNKKANMEKRMGNIAAAEEIYDKAIKMAHEKQNLKILPLLYINFARFTFVITGSVDATNEVFFKGIQQNPCKLILEGFLDFMTMHGGKHLNTVDCKMAALLSPESYVSQALNSHDREKISESYLKFVDLYGTIGETRLAWERHRKLFPHIVRPSSICDYSSNGFQIPSKKNDGPKDMQTNSPNYSSENPSKNILVKHLVENPSPINLPIIVPEETPNFELKSSGKEDSEKGSQECIAAEPIHILDTSFPGESEIDAIKKVVTECQNVAQIPHASSECHENEMPIQSYGQAVSLENLEPPALANLSLSSTDFVARQTNTVTSHDHIAPQEATSKEDGNKFEGDGAVGEILVMHSSSEIHIKSDSDSVAKLKEDSSHSHPAIHALVEFQETVNTNHALTVSTKYPQTASNGGQRDQLCHSVNAISDPNAIYHGNIQSSNLQPWQAHGQMQNQSGGTNQELHLTQSYTSLTPSLANSQDPQASHTQFQYQLAATQAYTNSGLAFLGQNMQQPAPVYAPDQQVQHASSQTPIQAYQNISHIDDQYGYYQSFQGIPHIWHYYQNLYYSQQQQLQQMQHGQQMNYSQQQQFTDPSEARNSQQELLKNQEKRVQLQAQTEKQQHHRNLDEKLNATKKQQDKNKKLNESTQPIQQSMQMMNSEQSQHLYLQQQHVYLQQQQHHQVYMQQQHLLQQQQQQQQQQQFLLLQQQQLLQLQHQPMQFQQQQALYPQQQQSLYPQQQQQQSTLQQQGYQLQQQTNALELKAVESNVYTQGNSHSTEQSMNSPDR